MADARFFVAGRIPKFLSHSNSPLSLAEGTAAALAAGMSVPPNIGVYSRTRGGRAQPAGPFWLGLISPSFPGLTVGNTVAVESHRKN